MNLEHKVIVLDTSKSVERLQEALNDGYVVLQTTPMGSNLVFILARKKESNIVVPLKP